MFVCVWVGGQNGQIVELKKLYQAIFECEKQGENGGLRGKVFVCPHMSSTGFS